MGLFGLDRGAHTELAVEALGVPVRHLFEGGELDVFDGVSGAVAADEGSLFEPVRGRREGVVAGVADGAG